MRPPISRRGARSCTAALILVLSGCGSGGSHPRPVTTTTATGAGARVERVPATTDAVPAAAAQEAAIRRIAAFGKPVYCGGRHGKLVALTFDDGPGPYTHIVLRQLREAGARATFFVVGTSVAKFEQLPKRERELGAIGDHTMTHTDLASLPLDAAMGEVHDGLTAALQAAGPPVQLFRPPYGSHTDAIDAQLGRESLVQVLWDVDSEDSRLSPPADYKEISRNVRRDVRPGSIVLMHENRGQTIRALRGILPSLRRRGLRAVTIPELLAADPPSATQIAQGRRGCGAVRATGPSSG